MLALDLPLRTPWMNAAGTLGFAPNPRGPVPLDSLGAFVTNPISPAPRTPADRRGVVPFAGGFLLHSGLPNPGLRLVIQRYAARWAASPLPVMVHLLTSTPAEAAGMVRRLEEVEGVAAIELGLPPGITASQAAGLAMAASGELPLVVCLPPEAVETLAPALREAGVFAVSLAAPRGTLIGAPDSAVPGPVTGRLYGPAVLPFALAAVQAARRAGFQVIGSGGIYHRQQVDAMLQAGAWAVQLDGVLWRGGFE
jgi:dihydroorotate dehydrogenase (NAD+) catalytic subunit